jgi:hypothetical protein
MHARDRLRLIQRLILFNGLCIAFLCVPNHLHGQATPPKPISGSKGTVNIILAQGNSLVAVTDSMLTNDTIPQTHEPDGTKLFKIDDQTICAMAGLYQQPGPERINDFAVDVPSLMRQFAEHEFMKRHARSFWQKAHSLMSEFQFVLSHNLQAQFVGDPTFKIESVGPLELTLAGYDNDGSLMIAEVTLLPKHLQRGGVGFEEVDRQSISPFPTCHSNGYVKHVSDLGSSDGPQPILLRVGDSIFCETAGYPILIRRSIESRRQLDESDFQS